MLFAFIASSGPATAELAEPEDDEFSRFDRRQSDFDDQLTAVTYVRRVGFFVTFHKKCLLRRQPEQGAAAPHARQEGTHIAPHSRPQVLIVRLKNHPLRTLLDGFFDEIEQAPDVDVTPGRIATDRACAPNANAAAGKRPYAIDAD